jgi:hypothetical protein
VCARVGNQQSRCVVTANRRCSEPSSSTLRSPPIDLPHTPQKIRTHPTIMVAMAEAGGAMWKKWEKRGWRAQTDLAKNEWGGWGSRQGLALVRTAQAAMLPEAT